MRNPRAIGFAALAFILSLAATATASAQAVNYTGQTTASVTVFYFNLPAGTRLYFRDEVSGTEIIAATPLVSGTGSVTILFNVLSPGPAQLYVLARQAGGWVAQSVMFYIFI